MPQNRPGRNGAPNGFKRNLPPVLEDSPYQKEFVTTFDEFTASLRMVSILSIVIFALGIFARIFTRSTVALELSTLASILILNWFFGMLATNKTKKELANVQFRNLNGSFGFESLMAFC
jgi:hypothetical protein